MKDHKLPKKAKSVTVTASELRSGNTTEVLTKLNLDPQVDTLTIKDLIKVWTRGGNEYSMDLVLKPHSDKECQLRTDLGALSLTELLKHTVPAVDTWSEFRPRVDLKERDAWLLNQILNNEVGHPVSLQMSHKHGPSVYYNMITSEVITNKLPKSEFSKWADSLLKNADDIRQELSNK